MANTGVTGRIVFAGTDIGIPDLTVRAFDIDPISGDDLLGTARTIDGNFSITYTPDKYRPWFAGDLGEQPDIEVRVYGDGERVLWETPKQNSVDDDVLVIPTIEIHKNNLRVPEDRSDQERRADPYWLVTHTSLDPANGDAVRLTRGNQLDWLVDGAVMFPAVTDDIARGLPEQPGQPPDPAVQPVTSIKLMNMAFDAEALVSKFDFTPKTPETVEATDVVTVRKLGPLMVKQAVASVPVHVLVWDLEDSIGGGVGGLLDKADSAAEVRKFFQGTTVQFGTFKSTQLLHVKLVVVDGTTGYVIGSTMKQGYSGDQHHLIRDGRHGVPNPKSKKGNRQLMHDVSLRVKGPSVRSIDQTFSTIWAAGNENTPAPAPISAPIGGPDAPVAMQVLRTLPGEMFITATPGPDVEHVPHGETGILESYQRAIMKAEEYIYIEDQYFNSPEIVAAIKLRMAEREELEVILVVNARPDIGGYHEQQVELITDLRAGGRKDRVGVFTMWSSDASQPIFEIAHI
jgi:phosphatidylserine/phosphatidylglycerophosphate/cardiolipin synthase-like enzyme